MKVFIMDEYKKQSYIDALNNIFSEFPPVKIGEVAGNLKAAKEEMEKVKKDGYDNYAHRLGMCLNGQRGLDSAIYSLGMGVGKELKDIFCKTSGYCGKKDTFINNLKDSWKDTKNNLEGVSYGLTNPNESCRIWLQDLDYGANKWKK